MSQPRLAVAIPVYNASQCIDSTLHTVQKQSWDNLEIVIGIDPSSDDSAERCLAHARADSRIKVFQNVERLGWGGNVRETVSRCESDWWSVFPQDDLWHPDYLRALWDTLQGSEADFSYCDLQAFSDGESFGTQCSPDFSHADASERLAAYYDCVAIPNLWHGLFPRCLAEETPFPAEPYNFPALDNLWVNRVLCRYRGAHLPKPLYFKRMSDAEFQTCTWWWNKHANSSDRAQSLRTIHKMMREDTQAAVGDDSALFTALELAMDIRGWAPSLLRDNHEEAAMLYDKWVPDGTATSAEDGLRWLVASRCSAALGETERAMSEAQRAIACEGADWRAWQHLAQLYARGRQFFEAQQTLFQARLKYPNQFQLGKSLQAISRSLIKTELEESLP